MMRSMLACFVFLVALGLMAVRETPVSPRAFAEEKESLKDKLARKVTRPAGFNQDTLDKAMASFCREYDITYRIERAAFADRGIDLAKRNVAIRPVKDTPMGDILQEVLDQVPATYRVEKEVLVIVPKTK